MERMGEMEDYIIERDDYEEYKNGLCFFSLGAPPHTVMARAHLHNSVEIIYVKRGIFTICADDKIYQMSAGDVILFRSNTIHYIISGDQEGLYYVLKIQRDAIKNLSLPIYEEEYTLSLSMDRQAQKYVWTKEEIDRDIPSMRTGLELLCKNSKSNEKFSDMILKIAVEMVLLAIMQSGGSSLHDSALTIGKETAQVIYQATEYITKNYDKQITCQTLCQMSNMSYSYFSRMFKAVIGSSFKDYLNAVRVNRAENLIVNTNKSITEICHACGFNNTAYFSKVYKEIKGCTPLTSRTEKI